MSGPNRESIVWRKSSSCASSSCVEVDISDTIRVRDTAGNVCEFDRDEFDAFLAGVKAGEFDVD